MTGIALLGCGYISDLYLSSLAFHPELTLIGVHDRERARAESLARAAGVAAYPDLDALCADDRVEIVVNLTNPASHLETSSALLEAGKHVYTEKPLATTLADGETLVALAEARGRMLVSAPCTLLAPAARRLWHEVRAGSVGAVRLVYAEMDDGMIHRAPVAKWTNAQGVVWPSVDEFQTGCTVEHAGYVLTWLCAMFGPVVSLTAQAEQLVPDKVPGLALKPAADLSVAMLRFESGVVARMTNGLYAPQDHGLRVFGDDGVLSVDQPRADAATVALARYAVLRRRRFLWPRVRRWRPSRRSLPGPVRTGRLERDAMRGVAEMAAAAQAGRAPHTGGRFALHVAEVTLACHHALSPADPEGAWPGTMPYRPRTRFPAPEPLEVLP